MTLLSFWPWRKPIAALAAPAPSSAYDGVLAEAPEEEEEPALGCGWFDSSHALHAGLLVCEHASPDAVANELPLACWLQLHLRTWQGCDALAQAA